MAPFQGVEHHVQTNATLIDDAWCEFFREHDVRVGVSIDGTRRLTAQRVLRGGSEAYDRIVKGIETLRRHNLSYAALCVVSDPKPGLAQELYCFFLDAGLHRARGQCRGAGGREPYGRTHTTARQFERSGRS